MPQSNKPTPTQQVKYFWELTDNEGKSTTNYTKLLKLYVLPLATLVIFLAVLLGLTLPALFATFESLDKIELATQEVKTKDTSLVSLDALSLRYDQLVTQVSSLNALVPSGTSEIAKFQSELVSLALSEGLSLRGEPTTGEQVITFRGNANNLELLEIPATFTLAGSLTQVRSFISKIQSLDSFVIIGEMTLRIDVQNIWALKLTLYKYQFPESTAEVSDERYLSVPINARYNQIVLDLLSKNSTIIPL